ncbi:hypothetical protein INS49_007670 [Diaporthe citri]|uniref:uncharacterized protein n=1 Tax=Diaporthe citri TaxID=83186 RepID=UPI001C7FB439|nr:uncharacterized protein INS49_007670 [Diaporthe citri]KAG6362578.1 hypothetical protein INS49_007670 [Diaporthe citri]
MAASASSPNQNLTGSLWDKAYNRLDKTLRSSLGQATTHKRDVLAAVLRAAEDKRDKSLQGRWKVKLPNREIVIVRDVLEKITRWVVRFKEVGDIAVQYDPTHASLPWAAVRFLLQVTVNDIQQYGAMLVDIEVISRLITRYKEFELLHLPRNAPVPPPLDDALTSLYTEVLIYLARAIDVLSERTLLRLAKAPFRLGDEERMQRILKREDEVWKLAKLNDTEKLRSVEVSLVRLIDQASISSQMLDDERHGQMRSKSARLSGLDLARLKTKECVDLIIEIVNDDPITIVLDAIDQIRDAQRFVLFDAMNRILGEAANVVKIFLTSRNDTEVVSSFPTAKTVSTNSANVRGDMQQFIHLELDNAKLLNGCASSEVRTALADEILAGAGEMFLWAHRQIQQLRMRKIKQEEDLLPALKTNILADLDQLYEETLQQVLSGGDTARSFVIHIFSWLLYMKSPLTLSTLIDAMSVSKVSSAIINTIQVSDMCAHLVVADTRQDAVRFAHQSIKEYLLRAKQDLFSPCISHALLASTCIEVCSRGPPHGQPLEVQILSIYVYAAMYWAPHFKGAEVLEGNSDLFMRMLSFVVDEDDMMPSLSFETWMDTAAELASLLPNHHPMKPALDAIPNEQSSPVFLAAVFGVDGLLKLLVESGIEMDWNQRNKRGTTAVYLAAAFGNASTVSFLINQGAEVNVECGRHGSPLHAACYGGHEEAVKRLLSHNASVTCGKRFENAFDACTHGDHEEIAIVLVQSGTIKTQEDYEHALQAATEFGFISLLAELQKPSFKSFRQNDMIDRQKARMTRAIKGGQLGVLRKVLSRASDPSTLVEADAVATAASCGHNDIIRFLLGIGMDIEAKGEFGTPLRSACLMGRKSTVQLLMEQGAGVNSSSSENDTLHAAAGKGHAAIVKMLVQGGAYVNRHDSMEFALSTASENGITTEDINKMVFSWPPTPEKYNICVVDKEQLKRDLMGACASGDKDGVSSVLACSLRAFERFDRYGRLCIMTEEESSRRAEVVECLLVNGADPSSLDGQDAFPIQVAANLCPAAVIGKLMDAGADVMYVHDGESALDAATERNSGSANIVRMILEAGGAFPMDLERGKILIEKALKCFHVDPYRDYFLDFPYPDGRLTLRPSLVDVFENGPGAVLELLLRQYPDHKTDEEIYICVLQMVCLLGKQDLVELLLTRGADPNRSGYCYGTPLQAAARSGQLGIVGLLLRHGASVNTVQGRWDTALRAATIGGHSDIVRLLMSHGADINLKAGTQQSSLPDDESRSPSALQLAVASGDMDTVNALLEAGAVVDEDCRAIVQMLVDNGADPNIDECAFGKPLHIACLIGSTAIVTMLLDVGADVNAANGYFGTPLFAAMHGEHSDVVSLLLEHGADVNYVHQAHGTPLHFACAIDNGAMTRRLLQHGASVAMPNQAGQTPLTLALKDPRQNRYHSNSPDMDGSSLLSIVQEASQNVQLRVDVILEAARINVDLGPLLRPRRSPNPHGTEAAG